VCYSLGAINSLLVKMDALMENHPMMKGLLQDIKSIRDDLLNKFSRGRITSQQVKVWMKQVREMFYDIEDWIDVRQGASSFSESDRKQIEQFMDQIKEARSRCERYELLSQVPTSDPEVVFAESNETAGCGSLWKNTVLVGIDGAKSELLNHLKDQQKELKVVSILGAGGHGKTTLAKEICGDIYIKEQFECQAFVSIGLTTSTRTTLIKILSQVKPEADAWQSTWSCNEIITEIWGFLRTKRYFEWGYFNLN